MGRLVAVSEDAELAHSSFDSSYQIETFALSEDAEAAAATLKRLPWKPPVINCMAWLENESNEKLREGIK